MSDSAILTPASHPIHSTSWVMFTQLSFVIAIAAMAGGIFWLDLELAVQGYLAMASLLIVTTSITMSKTIRDQHEAGRVHSRVDQARLSDFLSKHDPLLEV